MSSRLVLTAIAAALCAGVLPAFGQASGLDRNVPDASNQLGRPVDRNSFEGVQGEKPPRAGGRREQPRQEPARPEARRDNDNRQPDRRNWDRRGNDRRDYGYVAPRANIYFSAPPVYYSAPPVYYGAVPQPYYPYAVAPPVFRAGDYLPPEYRAQQFVVEDWQWRGLPQPPYGYHWLLLGPDNFALVADATGQILSLVAAR